MNSRRLTGLGVPPRTKLRLYPCPSQPLSSVPGGRLLVVQIRAAVARPSRSARVDPSVKFHDRKCLSQRTIVRTVKFKSAWFTAGGH